MKNKERKQQPSKTAFYNALHRALGHKLYEEDKLGGDHLADVFLPWHHRMFLKIPAIQKNTKQKLDDAFPGLNAYVTARTAFFDQLFVRALQENIPQIVMLGAGYDSRPYRFSELNQDTLIFELDRPTTQNKKKQSLKKARLDIPDFVRFVPIDLNQVTLDLALGTAGYQSDKTTLFTWEGVSYYLDPVSVDKTLQFFSKNSNEDSILAFDYMITIDEDNADQYYGAKSFVQSMQDEHPDEQILFSLKEGEIYAFLHQKGLQVGHHFSTEEIVRRYGSDDQGESIGKITGHFRFVLVKPQDN